MKRARGATMIRRISTAFVAIALILGAVAWTYRRPVRWKDGWL